MAHKIRRVITGHDKDGKAICVSDEMATEILQRDSRPGVTLTNFWQSKTTPSEYDGAEETLGGPFILHPPKKTYCKTPVPLTICTKRTVEPQCRCWCDFCPTSPAPLLEISETPLKLS